MKKILTVLSTLLLIINIATFYIPAKAETLSTSYAAGYSNWDSDSSLSTKSGVKTQTMYRYADATSYGTAQDSVPSSGYYKTKTVYGYQDATEYNTATTTQPTSGYYKVTGGTTSFSYSKGSLTDTPDYETSPGVNSSDNHYVYLLDYGGVATTVNINITVTTCSCTGASSDHYTRNVWVYGSNDDTGSTSTQIDNFSVTGAGTTYSKTITTTGYRYYIVEFEYFCYTDVTIVALAANNEVNATQYQTVKTWGTATYSSTATSPYTEINGTSSTPRKAISKTQYQEVTAWGSWSSWSTTAVSATTTRKVETATFYSYPQNYTIKYNGNGSTSGSMSDQTDALLDGNTTLVQNAFSKTGKGFGGWSLSASGTTEINEQVYAGGSIPGSTIQGSKNFTFTPTHSGTITTSIKNSISSSTPVGTMTVTANGTTVAYATTSGQGTSTVSVSFDVTKNTEYSVALTANSSSFLAMNTVTWGAFILTYSEELTIFSDQASVTASDMGNPDTGAIVNLYAQWLDPVVVSVTNGSATYNGSPTDGGASVTITTPSTGGSVMYGTSEGTYDLTSIPTYTNAGTYTVYYKATAPKYSEQTGSLTITIAKASGSVTAPVAKTNLTYTGSPLTLIEAGSSTTGTIQYKLGTGSYSTSLPQATNAGTYTVYYKVVGSANYNDVAESSINVTISKATITATAKNKSITYGDAPTNNGVTYSGFKGSDTSSVISGSLSYTYGYSKYGDVGTYNIIPNVSGLSATNYNFSGANGTLTVNQKEVTLSWGTTSWAYDGNAHSTTVTVGGLVNSDSVTATLTNNSITDVGTKTVTASGLNGTKSGNYKLPSQNTTTLTITASELTVNAPDQSYVYNGSPQGVGIEVNMPVSEAYTVKYGTTSGTYNLTSAPQITNVADSKTIYYQVTSSNYATKTGSYKLTITKANGSVTAPVAKTNLIYTGSALTLIEAGSSTTGTIQYKLGTGSYSTSLPQATNAGTYTVYYKVVGSANYNDVAESSINVTIEKASVGDKPNTSVKKTYSAGTTRTNGYTTPTGVTMEGNNSGTEVGTYTATYTPDANHKWSDGTSTSVTVTLKIVASVVEEGVEGDYVIKFDANGGIGTMDDYVCAEGSCTIPTVKYAKVGYAFIGWKFKAVSNLKVNLVNTETGGETTLTLGANGGVITEDIFTSSNDLLGWALRSGSTEIYVTNGGTITTNGYIKEMTLYTVWDD